MKIYLFNPEHDMALASFSPHYKAPTEIIRMKDDLSALPVWYAERGDVVKVFSDEYKNEFSLQCTGTGVLPYGTCCTDEEISDLFSVFVEDPSLSVSSLVDVKGQTSGADVTGTEVSHSLSYSPWGWDPALKKMLVSLTKEKLPLPDEEQLEQIRSLSGRQQCVKVLHGFREFQHICGKAKVCRTIDEVKVFLGEVPDVILKAPWSGSGRGLTRTSQATWNANLEGWVARILRTQGGIMAEPIYNKVSDFAMEFLMNSQHHLSFAGYSLFETDSHGNYKENVLISNERILDRLTQFVSIDVLEKVKQQLLHSLTDLLGTDYVGYFGVDMMICDVDANYVVHPCVEINLRMNMGVVARLLFDRYIDSASVGSYVVEHFSVDGEAMEHDKQLRELYPAQVTDGKMVDGYFPLTPVFSNTRYQCYVLLKSE